ncbi:hypothetical protein ILYODFUR_032940 [Ilyodon furcidens]|uniref:Uncharacterized protein n=1 Tax=Ilyodon furcidens TaxID=33524 RepID=A0ABV0T2M4_9TELE
MKTSKPNECSRSSGLKAASSISCLCSSAASSRCLTCCLHISEFTNCCCFYLTALLTLPLLLRQQKPKKTRRTTLQLPPLYREVRVCALGVRGWTRGTEDPEVARIEDIS